MAVNWIAHNLSGAKDNSNRTFTIPVIPDPRATRVYFNGDILYRVGHDPVPTQYAIIGNVITLGHPPGPDDDVWMAVAEVARVVAPNIVETRPDFYFHIELRDSQGQLKEVFQRDIDEVYWHYAANGGCGACEIALGRLFDSYGDIQVDDEVRIWRQLNPMGALGAALPARLPILLGSTPHGARELRYSGIVREIEPVFDSHESVRLRCAGFFRQLGRVAVPERGYENMDIGAVVRDIVDTFVLPGTRVLRTPSLGLVPDFGQQVTDVFFDAMADEAVSSLAELANAEFGVRADRQIYFTPRSSVVRQHYSVGKDIDFYLSNLNGDDVVNKVFLRGADGFRAELNFGGFREGNQKERIVMAPFIASNEDAALWGNAYFARFGQIHRRGRLNIVGTDRWFENPDLRIDAADHPLGLLRVTGAPRFIGGGAPLPAQLPMALAQTVGAVTDHRFRVASVKYTPGEGALNVEIELGERGTAGERLVSIERKLSELRQFAA